jgi:uracil-DNA glycosylase family 4
LIRLKQLVKQLKVSPYDFWILLQKKDTQDPLVKCLWTHYEIRPSDLKWLESLFGRDQLNVLCGKAEKLKKTSDIFEVISHRIQTSNNVNKSILEERLERYKQWVIKQIQNKPNSIYKGCHECPLKNQPFVPPDYLIGDSHRNEVDILIVGMNPYKDEVKHNKPFAGRSGQELREKLQLHFADKNIVITNSVMCFIPDNKDPDQKTLECCKSLLIEQIRIVKPKVIVPLGGLAASNLLKQQIPITKKAGCLFEIEIE